jgi:RNA polymerase sigma factor (TIGR02999 family)
VPSPDEITHLLQQWSDGQEEALEKLIPCIYPELRRVAMRYMARERPEHTLQTTALINEAFLRLVDCKSLQWQNRAHFYAVSAQMMRRILVDHARSRREEKRGGGRRRVCLDDVLVVCDEQVEDLLAVNEALNTLATLDPRTVKIVELRFFAGLTVEETADVLRVSHMTVARDWAFAKGWLLRQLTRKKNGLSGEGHDG